MKEREVRRYLDYLGVGPASNKTNDTMDYKKRTKRSLSSMVSILWKSPKR